jgi:uncharacterized membrane protein
VSRFRRTGLLDWTFEVALIFKGLDGLLEILGGALLLAVSKETLDAWLVSLTQHELSEDPNDWLFTHLLSGANNLSGSSHTFAALYLLSHGVVKVVLVVAVLKDKLWAYPWMIGFLLVFIGYQLYRMAIDATIGIALLTAFDAFIVWLTLREYRQQRLVVTANVVA